MPSWSLLSLGTLSASGLLMVIMRYLLWGKTIFCNCSSPSGLHAIITGADSGIGRACAFELAKRKWKLTLACRNLESAHSVQKEITTETRNTDVGVLHLNLEDPSSIRDFVSKLPEAPIHSLINNAAIMASNFRPVEAYKGINSVMGTNYIGHFYLTHLLTSRLKQTFEQTSILPRVIIVSSSISSHGKLDLSDFVTSSSQATAWDQTKAYGNSKLACNYFARELHRRYGTGDNKFLNVYCLFTSGMVNTNLNRDMVARYSTPMQWLIKCVSSIILKTPREGCQSIVHCAVSDNVPGSHSQNVEFVDSDNTGSGLLYRNCHPIPWPEASQDMEKAKVLWDSTIKFLDEIK